MYAVSVTALWAYDWLLTLKDEVAEFHDDDDVERGLTHLMQVRYAWKTENVLSTRTFVLFVR